MLSAVKARGLHKTSHLSALRLAQDERMAGFVCFEQMLTKPDYFIFIQTTAQIQLSL